MIWLLVVCLSAANAGTIPDEPSQGFQDQIQFSVPLDDKRTLSLKLQKSNVVNASLPVYLGTDRYSFSRWDDTIGRDFVVYQDPERLTSFVMWSENGKKGDWRESGIRGIIEDDDHVYQIEPIQMRQHVAEDPAMFSGGNKEEEKTVIRINDIPLVVNKVNKTAHPMAAIEQRLNDDVFKLSKEVNDFIETEKQLGHSYPTYYYEVELFLVVDFALFEKWLRLSKEYDYRARERDAIDNIRFYFAHVLNGVNQRYVGIDDQALQIRIRPVGIYIAKTRSASYWTEGYGIKESYQYSEAYKALDAFEEWINMKDINLPPFDQATLYTGNHLFSGWYSGKRRTISGLADIRGICSPKRASINRDIGVYASIQTGAHELGHNLGAFHDGYDNPCSSRDQYIMATSPGVLTDRNRNNPTKFSYCSRDAFWQYLLYLSNKGKNCLLTRDNYVTWDINYELNSKPGERYSVDEQCKIVFGLQSFYCGGGDRDDQICTMMYCWDPLERKCKGNPEQRAADRTQCGDRKWCDRSECVYDSRAPSAADPECVYGDYQDVVEKNRKCYDLGISESYRCYEKNFRDRCCETCKKIKKMDNPTCPFGDRDPDYCLRSVRSSDCYDKNTQDLCCETCAKYETGKRGCEYGDKLSYCRTMKKYRCYTQADDCCDTCRSPPSGLVPGCEWGDKASWCANLDIRSCENLKTRNTCCERCRSYGASGGQRCPGADLSKYCAKIVTFGGHCYRSEQQCCQTCASYVTNIPNCLYGDKFEWCSGYVSRNKETCQRDAYVKENCCQSCAVQRTGSQSSQPSCTDMASWCSNIHPGECYNSSTEKTCCATCKRRRKSSSTCYYGDEVSWCKPEYCSTSAQYCCETCRR